VIPPAIALEGVVWVGRSGRVLDGATFEVIPGEVVAVVGPEGSGKTTLLRIAAGVLRPHAGHACVGTWSATDPQTRRIVGYAPQNPAWPRAFTVREALEYWARFHVRGTTRPMVRDALGLAGLEEDGDQRIVDADTGVRRRLALAQAVLGGRRVLILDGFLGGLDAELRQELAWRLESRAAQGVAVLLAADSVDTVERVATRVLLLRQGRVVRSAAPSALLAERVLEVVLERPPLTAPAGFRVTRFGLEADLKRVTPEAALALCRAHRLSVRASHVRLKSLDELTLEASLTVAR
jgi:ABC-type multidrug transport system ATPase subunit